METMLLMTVTLVSLALAVVMSVVGWRLLIGDRRRSAARVEALELEALGAADAYEALPLLAQVVPHTRFDEPPRRGFGRRLAALTAAGVLMTGTAAVLAARHRSAGPAGPPRVAEVIAATPRPLELRSLSHAADADGSFAVTGLVANPLDGRPVSGVTAVIYLFDRDGRNFASGRATLDLPSLEPGEGSRFTVRVPAGAAVARYRVTFRREDGAVLPHVDRRTAATSAQSGARAPRTAPESTRGNGA